MHRATLPASVLLCTPQYCEFGKARLPARRAHLGHGVALTVSGWCLHWREGRSGWGSQAQQVGQLGVILVHNCLRIRHQAGIRGNAHVHIACITQNAET